MERDTPVFATSISRIRSYRHGVINEQETEMMEVRWKTLQSHKKILEQNNIIIEVGPYTVRYTLQ